MDPVKVCFVSIDFPPKGGGLAVAAKRVTGFLADQGWQVSVLTTAQAGAPATVSEEDGVTVHRVPFDFADSGSFFAYRQYLRALDQTEGFDIFHGFFLTDAQLCISATEARRHMPRPPVIASIRGGDENGLSGNPYYLSQFVRSIAKSTWLTSVNEGYLERMGRHVDIRGKSSVIRNGVRAANSEWRPEFGIVGTSGQFRREKDIPLLIRAYHKVAPELRRGILLVGGFADPQEEEWSKTLIDEFDLQAEVTITGHQPHSEVAGYLQRMRVYVQASAREGMPNALLEAAAVGVPIVATDVEGIKEIVQHEETGLLAPHGYPELLAAAIARVLHSPELADRLSQGARRMAATFSVERERHEWIALYRKLLGIGERLVQQA